MDLKQYEQMQPHVTKDGMKFFTPNSHCAWRIETLYTKEPDTVAWIKSMQPGEIFWDIGANIGQYSVLAAKQGLTVFAFEPESQNFSVLIRNVAFNQMFDKIFAYPICLSDECKLSMLRLSSLTQGGSCHSFDSDKNFKGEEKQWTAIQGSVSFIGDQLVRDVGMPMPTHVKIDVDGFEDKVLRGMQEVVLAGCKSVLVEMDSAQDRHMEWKQFLENHGFRTDPKQIEAARRTEGAFAGIGNIIFYRDDDGTATQGSDGQTADLQPSVGRLEATETANPAE